MKKKFLTAVSTATLLVPWTILPLRTFEWALRSPVAELLIASYAVFMIFSGVFTALSYTKEGSRNSWMKVCLLVNGLYAAGGAAALCMMLLPN